MLKSEAAADAVSGAPAAVPAPLTDATARGFVWLLIEALGTRVVTFFGQILLARILLDEHWGLVALAYTVTTFTDFAATSGLKEVLIQRQKRFDRWSNAAVWLSVVIGFVSAGLMMAAAPLAAWFYHEPNLPGLLAVLAASTILAAPAMVPEARLRSQLRFRAIAAISLGRNVGVMVLSVVLALAGFGALSFVIPKLVFAAVVTAMMWSMARPRIARQPQLRRWPNLLRDSTTVLGATIVLMLMTQGGSIFLGRFHDADTVGQYFFAYNLSLQMAIIFGLNLAAVLLPALNRLNDEPSRQLAAFKRAGRSLAILGVPFCLVQAAVAEPAVYAVFSAKWEPAIPVLQLLSIGMAPHLLWNSTRSLLLAQGRFNLNLILLCVYGVGYLTAVYFAARFGAEVEVAIAVAAFVGLIAPIDCYIAIRGCGGRWRDVLNLYWLPFALSTITILPAYFAFQQLPVFPGRNWALLLGIPFVSLSAYGLLVWRIAPDFREEFSARVAALRRRGPHR